MNKYDIICAGEMLMDFTPAKEPYTYTANPGGAPANVAVAAARNGLSTAFLGLLGNDDFGKRLKATLENEGIRLLCQELTDKAVTTLAFVTLYEGGERSFTFVRKPGADILLSPEDVNEEDIAACRLFHAGSFSLSDSPAREAVALGMRLAHDMGKIVSFDVNYRDSIWQDMDRCRDEIFKLLPFIDLLKISDEELFFVGGEENIPALMEKHNITVLIETLGSKGAKYYFKGKEKFIPGLKVQAVDATGAGDAFWGGFLGRLLMFHISSPKDITEEMVETALIYGNISGGLCVEKMGGIPAIPTREEISRRLASFTKTLGRQKSS